MELRISIQALSLRILKQILATWMKESPETRKQQELNHKRQLVQNKLLIATKESRGQEQKSIIAGNKGHVMKIQ